MTRTNDQMTRTDDHMTGQMTRTDDQIGRQWPEWLKPKEEQWTVSEGLRTLEVAWPLFSTLSHMTPSIPVSF